MARGLGRDPGLACSSVEDDSSRFPMMAACDVDKRDDDDDDYDGDSSGDDEDDGEEETMWMTMSTTIMQCSCMYCYLEVAR